VLPFLCIEVELPAGGPKEADIVRSGRLSADVIPSDRTTEGGWIVHKLIAGCRGGYRGKVGLYCNDQGLAGPWVRVPSNPCILMDSVRHPLQCFHKHAGGEII